MEHEDEATHALVFMVVAINGSWKLPFAHFFTKSINARDLVNLVSLAIDFLNESGVVVTNLTCDNAASNISMLNMLGASVSDHCKIKCSLDAVNILGIPILVVLDPCHLLKLVRNALSECKLVYSTNTSSIAQWHHIEALQDLQSKEGLHLANKLTDHHIHYQQQKMKVFLAAQVF